MTEQEMKIVRYAARRRLGNRGADMMLREIAQEMEKLRAEEAAEPLEKAEAEIDEED